MKHSNEEKIAYLFDELGSVDDALLQEARRYRSHRYATLRVLTAVAASVLVLTISTAILFSAALLSLGGWIWGGGSSEEVEPTVSSMDVMLKESVNSASYTLLSGAEEVSYFDGAYLLWQREGETEIYQSRPLSEAELSSLWYLIGEGERVGDITPTNLYRVWIIDGNGNVITPYLPATQGNVSASVLFDYEAELYPSQELISYISGILND